MGEKAGGVGFDWNNPREVMDKISEEMGEIEAEMTKGDKGRLDEEIGDLLFAVASLARKMEIDPEQSLRRALVKFRLRFAKLEQAVNDSGKKFGDYSLDQLEAIWQSIK
mgnify:FL=1